MAETAKVAAVVMVWPVRCGRIERDGTKALRRADDQRLARGHRLGERRDRQEDLPEQGHDREATAEPRRVVPLHARRPQALPHGLSLAERAGLTSGPRPGNGP